jgi:hypothetical protein
LDNRSPPAERNSAGSSLRFPDRFLAYRLGQPNPEESIIALPFAISLPLFLFRYDPQSSLLFRLSAAGSSLQPAVPMLSCMSVVIASDLIDINTDKNVA